METSLEITIENFKKLDIQGACQKSGAILQEDSGEKKTIVISYLNQEYLIHLPDVEIETSKKEEVETDKKIILLHYLISSKGTPLSGKLIDFRQVPEGNFYYSCLISLTHRPFLQTFGEKPQVFVKAGELLNGVKTELKDFSMKFLVLPKVPIIAVLYKGDEEFPPDCKFLFDSTISDYLSTEGIVKVCEELVKELANRTGDEL